MSGGTADAQGERTLVRLHLLAALLFGVAGFVVVASVLDHSGIRWHEDIGIFVGSYRQLLYPLYDILCAKLEAPLRVWFPSQGLNLSSSGKDVVTSLVLIAGAAMVETAIRHRQVGPGISTNIRAATAAPARQASVSTLRDSFEVLFVLFLGAEAWLSYGLRALFFDLFNEIWSAVRSSPWWDVAITWMEPVTQIGAASATIALALYVVSVLAARRGSPGGLGTASRVLSGPFAVAGLIGLLPALTAIAAIAIGLAAVGLPLVILAALLATVFSRAGPAILLLFAAPLRARRTFVVAGLLSSLALLANHVLERDLLVAHASAFEKQRHINREVQPAIRGG